MRHYAVREVDDEEVYRIPLSCITTNALKIYQQIILEFILFRCDEVSETKFLSVIFVVTDSVCCMHATYDRTITSEWLVSSALLIVEERSSSTLESSAHANRRLPTPLMRVYMVSFSSYDQSIYLCTRLSLWRSYIQCAEGTPSAAITSYKSNILVADVCVKK